MKTPMQELRDKIAHVLSKIYGTHEHLNGYREALQSVLNDIDTDKLEKEKQAIMDAYEKGDELIEQSK